MLCEIGSNFWIKPDELELSPLSITPSSFGCDGGDYVWMSTCRSATALVLDTIEQRNPSIRKVAVIPPFTCHTVVEPFLARGYDVYTYHVGLDLISSAHFILDTVIRKNAGVVLFHSYFGVNTINDYEIISHELNKLGVKCIEDCTHNLYSLYRKSLADYYVGSIRKWCGVPDGGFAVCKEGTFSYKPQINDEALVCRKKEASLRKYEYLFEHKGEKAFFLNSYREAEDILNGQCRYYSIANLSVAIQSNLDVDYLRERRRENFIVVTEGLKDVSGIKVFFQHLKDNEVPLYCPILCDDRNAIQSLLAQDSIYAPVIWPKASCCPEVDEDSEYLYLHILCIPIDQRYGIEEMQKIVCILSKQNEE